MTTIGSTFPLAARYLKPASFPGQVYLDVITQVDDCDGSPHLKLHRTFDAPDNAGYYFLQARGLVVLGTAIGLLAVLPIGMAQISSVILTAEVGKTLWKGRDLSYSQFGGE